jgi:hypothetical protein
MQLRAVAGRCGTEVVLFDNIEASDLEYLPSVRFAEKVKRALCEGVTGDGRGFVLMPSACPYGREITGLTLRNYHTLVKAVEALGG